MDPRPMYSNEVERLCLLFPDLKPTNAELLEAICWSYKDITCQKLTLRASEPPTDRIWTFSSAGKHGSPRVDTRPATTTEIEKFISVLRDFTCGDDLLEPVAEAHYDVERESFEISFVGLARMVEGLPYKRWYIRYHPDRAPSVGYILETRRNDGFDTLPECRILRGEPW